MRVSDWITIPRTAIAIPTTVGSKNSTSQRIHPFPRGECINGLSLPNVNQNKLFEAELDIITSLYNAFL